MVFDYTDLFVVEGRTSFYSAYGDVDIEQTVLQEPGQQADRVTEIGSSVYFGFYTVRNALQSTILSVTQFETLTDCLDISFVKFDGRN
tara:strand:- start:306 stop:569 length:264 start_codon:yes stop_codon:yes gene_type:complete